MCAGVAPCGGVSVLKPLAGSRYIYVLILLYLCPHTAIYVSSYCYMCVFILPYTPIQTTICVSYAICGRCSMLTRQSGRVDALFMCPHTTLLYSRCPHTSIHPHIPTYSYICVLVYLGISCVVYTCSSRWLPAERLPAALTYA